MEEAVSPLFEALSLPDGVEPAPGMDQRIEALVDAVWRGGALPVPELVQRLGWSRHDGEEVLAESESLGVVVRIRGVPHDIVDLG